MSQQTSVAIVGCGAVTARYYLPALLACRDRVSVIGVHDSDPGRMAEIAQHFPGAVRAASFEALTGLAADILIVASPPAAHSVQAIAALRAGSHVLCEKPMAPTLAEAVAMADAARASNRLLAINMVRRHFPATLIVERLIASGILGALRSAQVFEGDVFRWPVKDQAYFSQAMSGGGVLADIGPHIIDLLACWFEKPALARYQDDAMGGVEANALLALQCRNAPVSVRLSRDWARPNAIELCFEHGTICWRAEFPTSVDLRLKGEATPLKVEDEVALGFTFEDCFKAQIEALIDAISGRSARVVTAEQALPTVALIEQAYRERTLIPMPWLQPLERAGHG